MKTNQLQIEAALMKRLLREMSSGHIHKRLNGYEIVLQRTSDNGWRLAAGHELFIPSGSDLQKLMAAFGAPEGTEIEGPKRKTRSNNITGGKTTLHVVEARWIEEPVHA